MVYEAPEGMLIRGVCPGRRGVLLTLQRFQPAEKAACRLIWLRELDSPPVESLIDNTLPRSSEQLFSRSLSANWLPDGRILLAWTGRDTALQWVSPEAERITPASERLLPWGFGPLGAHFSPDGRYAVATNIINGHFSPQVGDERSVAMVFRTSDWEMVWYRNSRFLWDARFSPDGQWLLISGDEAWCVPVDEIESGQ